MGEIRTERYTAGDAEMWDRFVAGAVNGTLFHRRRFLAYHPRGRFEDASLLLWDGGALRAVFPAAALDKAGKRVLRSHPGASYGGLAVARPPGIAGALALVEALVRRAREAGFDRIELRTPPRIYQRAPVGELEAAMIAHGITIVEQELSTCYHVGALPDGAGEDAIVATFHAPCRRAVRKALKAGLRARLCTAPAELEMYHAMLTVNLEKHGATPTHTAAELAELATRFPADVQLLAVFDGDDMVAGIMVFVSNQQVAHCFYFASRAAAQGSRPLNLAVLELVRLCHARGVPWINFGISTEDSGRAFNRGLFRFKESFGGGGVLRHYWRGELS